MLQTQAGIHSRLQDCQAYQGLLIEEFVLCKVEDQLEAALVAVLAGDVYEVMENCRVLLCDLWAHQQ